VRRVRPEKDQRSRLAQCSTARRFAGSCPKTEADNFGGIAVYRDGLRVMPYGRPDADFLQLEERRSRHAGRYFWAHRRTFGRIAFTRDDNPALRDKAGREGLVENQANREMRILVKEVLIEFAALYFGTDSTFRQGLLPAIIARKAAQREAANQARTRRRRTIRQFLREQAGELDNALQRAETLLSQAHRTQESEDRVRARQRQGEKGIGRLSAAFLGPSTSQSTILLARYVSITP
jgi:hypothetical protein